MRRFYGHVDGKGKFNPNLVDDMKKYIGTLIGKDIEIRVGIKGKARTNSQNSLYWLWLSCLEKDTGTSSKDFHMRFATLFLQDGGVLVPHFRSTTELNTVEFMEYMDKIEQWARENVNEDFKFPNPENLYN